MIREFIGVASTVIGLVCFALSTSFHILIGKWSPMKISLYIMLSFVICLAIMFPKAWQHWKLFQYKAHFTFVVLASTAVYSSYLDRKLKTKPDAYSIISFVAFATASLCISKQIECGFVDLLYFFCGVLITQLMAIKALFGVAGIGFSYFLVIIRCNLPDEPGNLRSHGHQTDQVAVDIFRLSQLLRIDNYRSRSSHASGAIDILASTDTPITTRSSNQNQQAIITPDSSDSLRHRSSRERPAKDLDIQNKLAINEEEDDSPSGAADIVPSISSFHYAHLSRITLRAGACDWLQNNILKMFQDFQTRLCHEFQNKLLNGRDDNEPLWHMIMIKHSRGDTSIHAYKNT